MWSCSACAITMRFRMSCAFSGISRLSAFSTVRTDAIAWTVVQTPQNLCVKSHASRGSRPVRIVSMPRNIWPEDQAFVTFPPLTSTSMRRWPSMRVIGSTTILVIGVPLLRRGGPVRRGRSRQNGESLDEENVSEDLDRDDADRREDLHEAREVRVLRARMEHDDKRVDAVERARDNHEERRPEEVARALAPLGRHEEDGRHDDERDLDEEEEHLPVESEQEIELSAERDVDEADAGPRPENRDDGLAETR